MVKIQKHRKLQKSNQKNKSKKFDKNKLKKLSNINSDPPRNEVKKNKNKQQSNKNFKQNKPKIAHEESNKWYNYQIDECRLDENKLDENLLQKMKKQAKILLEHDTNLFEQWYKSKNRGDAEWIDTVSQKGAFTDKISSIQLRIQRSPVHALSHLIQFVELIGKKGAVIRQAYTITKALKEIFLNELLPPGRKLLLFNQRPLEELDGKNGIELEKRLIMWIFEEKLKMCYKLFVDGLQILAGNVVEGVALNACKEMTELLIDRSEQEQFLLNSIVNKLGHPLYRVGSKVAMFLEQLVRKHPNMRLIVIKEVEQLIFRKNILPKAQRYGLHFLSRMLIIAGEFEIATCLVQIYLRFFRILVLNDALNEHHLLPLLITGLNRAFPYMKGKSLDSDLLKDIDSLYAIVQTAKFSISLNILRLLFQIHSASDGITDRFYCAFYRRILNLDAGSSNQNDSKFFSLLQRVLKNDLVECRVRAFIKRLFQVALTSSVSFAAATLLTCSAVIQERPGLLRLDESLENQMENENKTIKNEEQIKQENIRKDSALEQKLIWFEQNGNCNDEEEENYFDIKDESSEELDKEKEIKNEKNSTKKLSKTTGWVHRSFPSSSKLIDIKSEKQNIHSLPKRRNAYDPNARNPLFSGADFSLDTELYVLAKHYHPTVSSFARTLIQGGSIHYKGDPLIDLSHMRFLDRFAFKNPKTKHSNKEGDNKQKREYAMNPLFSHTYFPRGIKALNPTSQDYLNKTSSEIPLDERFLHHFASIKFKKNIKDEKNKQNKKGKNEKEDDFDDMASLNSDEFDLLLEKFEPGDTRDIFDVDFSTEFGDETNSKRKKKGAKKEKIIDEDDDIESELADCSDDEDLEDEEMEEFSSDEGEEKDESGTDYDDNEELNEDENEDNSEISEENINDSDVDLQEFDSDLLSD
ncbi:hypothetical protein ACQ4LE_004708 [Meloidogyne hapla]|uniref:CBF domain-containing protein n=1 Tax=Meloidogyne hapla TaxID=6305 RepID=A0A1I8BVJ0_MELHA